jgi:BMFP domain-containing protein YqiC
VELSKFISANLEKILGPLEVKAPLPRAELAQIRSSISSQLSKANLVQRPQFQAALKVTDALSQAMDERTRGMANPAAANWAQRSAEIRQNIEALMAQEKAAEVPATPAR